MEYTLAIVLAMIGLIFLDRQLKTHVLRVNNHPLWGAAIVFALFQFVLDNYFTSRGLWMFNSNQMVGVFIPFIPIENILYGFELLLLAIILYEFFARSGRD